MIIKQLISSQKTMYKNKKFLYSTVADKKKVVFLHLQNENPP
jgi:hypothetical protein